MQNGPRRSRRLQKETGGSSKDDDNNHDDNDGQSVPDAVSELNTRRRGRGVRPWARIKGPDGVVDLIQCSEVWPSCSSWTPRIVEVSSPEPILVQVLDEGRRYFSYAEIIGEFGDGDQNKETVVLWYTNSLKLTDWGKPARSLNAL